MRYKIKHKRTYLEYYALNSLVLHATGFLFNCVSPKEKRGSMRFFLSHCRM